MQPAIGQRGPVRSKATGPPLDPSTGAFKFPPYSEYSDEKDSSGTYGAMGLDSDHQRLNGFAASKRPSQDSTSAYLNAVGGLSRDTGIQSSNHSEADMHAQGTQYGDFYGGHPQNSSHSQRPSIAGPSMSFPAQNNRMYATQQMDDEEVHDKLRGLSLQDGHGGPSNGLSGLSTYGSASQPFQLNPVSQPWENGNGYQPGYSKDMYPSSFGYEKRGSIVDRNSPAGSAYRAGFSSPKSFAGTPQTGADPWPKPASRDPRIGPDLERRAPNQQFVPPQSQPAAYYGNQYFSQGFSHFQPHIYDQYGGVGFRQPVSMNPYGGLHVNSFVPGAVNVPMRPSKDQDPGKGVRSQLLEEFRANSKHLKRYELKDLYEHIVEFSGDQHGSRFIQQKLETANSDEKQQVFREIEPNAVQLMKDVFGNYVIQKFFEHGNQVQKKVLASAMKGKVIDLSTQMYACRVVQKALEHILVEQQAELIKELEPEVYRVVRDQNGNHVIQKIIELVPRQHIGFIIDCLKGRVSDLASHTYGCRVIQRVLEYGNESDKAAIMNELHNCAQMLVTDQYGNYVTQHVIQYGKPEDRAKMIAIVTTQLLTLSKHKFASNVVEKCIEYGTADERRLIRERFIRPGEEGNSQLGPMIKDQYGNYVVQKLFNELDGQDRADFVEEVKPQLNALKKSTGTGRQIAAIDRLMSAVSSPLSGTKNVTPSSTAPASPSLQVDIGSAVPTPNLTMETNSPSSSPPSPNTNAVEDVVSRANAKLAGTDVVAIPQPRADEV
ncbi:armadillo-type protein [Lasiosphaeria miniovina]|uniref:Pumilio homology domain family member 3 n=1 Tax=Lasiosphaeria miniovina TaxID=1954250 RepID=A0AA40AVV3_9PEZI|nr:armadillo-type protein [Lasiosphaeria miniovina]KAK0722983.1 armadillo-type protein [Lasiosphaeria miniovina]